jgi:hypothetical protein
LEQEKYNTFDKKKKRLIQRSIHKATKSFLIGGNQNTTYHFLKKLDWNKHREEYVITMMLMDPDSIRIVKEMDQLEKELE